MEPLVIKAFPVNPKELPGDHFEDPQEAALMWYFKSLFESYNLHGRLLITEEDISGIPKGFIPADDIEYVRNVLLSMGAHRMSDRDLLLMGEPTGQLGRDIGMKQNLIRYINILIIDEWNGYESIIPLKSICDVCAIQDME